MRIVTDSGVDLSPEQRANMPKISIVPLTINLDGKSYRSGVDVLPEEFYQILENAEGLPITSQPPAGEFAELYRELAGDDPDILVITISSGLSGTFNSAQAGAEMVPEANVTVFDTKTLSIAQGWHVEAAARAVQAGWERAQILDLLERIRDASDTIFTLSDLTYLIHGGRISHIRGLVASVLNIKPIIGVEHVGGTYEQRGRARSFKRAILSLADQIKQQHGAGAELRTQIVYADNFEGASRLRAHMDEMFDCHWLPSSPLSPVLGAHTGPSLVGITFAPYTLFDDLPWAEVAP